MSTGDLTAYARQQEIIAAGRISDAIARKQRYEDLNRALKGRVLSIIQSDPEYYKQLAAETGKPLDLIIKDGALGGKGFVDFMRVRRNKLQYGTPGPSTHIESISTIKDNVDLQQRAMDWLDAISGKIRPKSADAVESRIENVAKNAPEPGYTGTEGIQQPGELITKDPTLQGIFERFSTRASKDQSYGYDIETGGGKTTVKPGTPGYKKVTEENTNPYFRGTEDREAQDLEKLALLEESNKILTGVSGGTNQYDEARKQRIADFSNYIATINKPTQIKQEQLLQAPKEPEITTEAPRLKVGEKHSDRISLSASPIINTGDGNGGGQQLIVSPMSDPNMKSLAIVDNQGKAVEPGSFDPDMNSGDIERSGIKNEIKNNQLTPNGEKKWIDYQINKNKIKGRNGNVYKDKITGAIINTAEGTALTFGKRKVYDKTGKEIGETISPKINYAPGYQFTNATEYGSGIDVKGKK